MARLRKKSARRARKLIRDLPKIFRHAHSLVIDDLRSSLYANLVGMIYSASNRSLTANLIKRLLLVVFFLHHDDTVLIHVYIRLALLRRITSNLACLTRNDTFYCNSDIYRVLGPVV